MAKGERAHVAQAVEHVLGKDGVSSSILLVGSITPLPGARPCRGEGKKKGRKDTGGSNSGVESQPSKLLVAGSNPVSRSSLPRAAGRTGSRADREDGEEAERAMPRDLISLACGECKRRNYTTTKNKKTHQEKLEVAKYCRYCRKHTAHKEGKV